MQKMKNYEAISIMELPPPPILTALSGYKRSLNLKLQNSQTKIKIICKQIGIFSHFKFYQL